MRLFDMCNLKTVVSILIIVLFGTCNTMVANHDIINFTIQTNGGNETVIINLNPNSHTEMRGNPELLNNAAFNVTHKNETIAVKGKLGNDAPTLEISSQLPKNESFNDKSFSRKNTTITLETDDVKTKPDLCENSSFDAIISYKNETFVIKDDWYWKLLNKDITVGYKNALIPGYPKPISGKWPGLQGKIDTAFVDYNGKFIYFFKGSKYWKFNGEKMENEFPRDIGTDFPGVPNHLQAAKLHIASKGDVFFFKDDMYWLKEVGKDNCENSTIDSWWRGIPDNLDAALTFFEDKNYFFKGGVYYKTTIKSNSNDGPRSTASDWFGCF